MLSSHRETPQQKTGPIAMSMRKDRVSAPIWKSLPALRELLPALTELTTRWKLEQETVKEEGMWNGVQGVIDKKGKEDSGTNYEGIDQKL